MIQRDFILRQIQQLVQVLAHVLQLKRAGRDEEVREAINEALVESLGMDIDAIVELNKDELIELCTHESRLYADKALVIAELLEEEGVMSATFGNSARAEKSFLSALYLYEAMTSSGDAVPFDVYDRIARLRLQKRNETDLDHFQD